MKTVINENLKDLPGKINILTKMKSMLPNFTDSEKLITSFIMENPEKVYNLQINDLAKILNISTPTVFRFAQKLGFKGFKDFKVELIKDIAIEFNISFNQTDSGDDLKNNTVNIFNKVIENLKETSNFIDYNQLKQAVYHLRKAKRIIFFAIGSSLPVAFDSYMNFLRAGYNCFFNIESYSQRIISTQCNQNDVAIGISFSGESIEVVECMKNAKVNGAKTICVTTFMNSSITKFSDIKLFTAPILFEIQKIDIPSKKSQAVLLDSLYLNVILQNRKEAVKYISKSEEELTKFRKLSKFLY